MIQLALIFGYVLGTEATMAATTQSVGWAAAFAVTFVLLFSGKWIERLASRYLP